MATTTLTLRIKGLKRRNVDELARKAKLFGLTPERYVKQLLEEDLAISHEARTKTFAQIMGRKQDIDEDELDRLVEQAKHSHHEKSSRKKN
ncbi:MAG TPA: hypothetical protein VM008_00460 [Phycisphaerae bacterium]|nr:hypothetical protein [Phycisphaerae bacterium]